MIYLYRDNCTENSCDFRIAGKLAVYKPQKNVHMVKKVVDK